MGNYALCLLDDLLVGTTKNDVDMNLMSLFRSSDKVISTKPIPDMPPSVRDYYEEVLEEDSDQRVVYYATPLHIARERLEVMGYTLVNAKEAFRACVDGVVSDMIEELKSIATDNRKQAEWMRLSYENEIRWLSILTPESWMEGVELIHNKGFQPNQYGRYEEPNDGTMIGYMLSNALYGFPGDDMLIPLRLIIEVRNKGKELIYDVTDLVWCEYFDYDENLAAYARENTLENMTIVLTEGKTDTWILRESLRILYPHLQDYFTFLDFEAANIAGGVGSLASTVKAFIGAGITKNIVALFDNDTAAASACRALGSLSLPSNIVIRHLPELNFLKSYPTIGPSGKTNHDVNGLAASIELYLGEDVLRTDDGSLTPVQWTGYDRGMNQYQGEVLEKAELQKRFQRKLENQDDVLGPEWDGLRAVLAVIFSAFDEKHRNIISQYPKDYYSSLRTGEG